jgi:hypothetical protein
LAGTRRVFAVAFNMYSRPLVAKPDQLVPAADSCTQCHWPAEAHADKLLRLVEYGNDEKNTSSLTMLQMYVGGGDPTVGPSAGIHWHANPETEIEHVATGTDPQTIPYVRVKDAQGVVREYLADDAVPDVANREWRRMTCMDCHNRPGHTIAATPDSAVSEAMTRGAIPTTLPFVHC